MLNAGPIGGYDQTGNYKIDARFNKEEMCKKIQRIILYRDRINVWNLDAVSFLKKVFHAGEVSRRQSLVYMDPPYFAKAEELYPVYFKEQDHARLAKYLNSQKQMKWLVSYDDTEEIRALYSGEKNLLYMNYVLHSVRVGRELFIPSPNCQIPKSFSEGGENIFKSSLSTIQKNTKNTPELANAN